MLQSSVLHGKVFHQRHLPMEHSFAYPYTLLFINVKHLQEVQKDSSGWLGVNRWAPFAIYEDDVLAHLKGSLECKARSCFQKAGLDPDCGSIFFLTAPRYFGYVFNPVSFWCLTTEDGNRIRAIIAEVNNTFGETHLYFGSAATPQGRGFQFSHPKGFHVSPFFPLKGDYEWTVDCSETRLDISVSYSREDLLFEAALKSRMEPLSATALKQVVVHQKWNPWMTLPWIHKEAAVLYFKKKARVFTRAEPRSPMTIRRLSPTWVQSLCQKLVLRDFQHLRYGTLTLTLPNSETIQFGNQAEGCEAQIRIHSPRFFSALVLGSDIGFGESYMFRDWDTPDLTTVLQFFLKNADCFDERGFVFGVFQRLWQKVSHRLNSNSKQGSRKNIAAHYDLSNSMFQAFLDKGMNYSCAVYGKETETLEDAQQRKLHMMLDKACLKPGMQVLEIGSGWGSLAIEAARRHGVEVKSITLSHEQLRLARQRASEASVSDRVTFEYCDYRDVRGQYDAILSIEMLEAVGHEHLPRFFQVCDQRLRADGIAVLQVISMPDAQYEEYRKNCDWIQKYIFPGAVCPSFAAMVAAMQSASKLQVQFVENLGPNYAKTLKDWRERFLDAADASDDFGRDEEFRRTWEYYFSYCEAGFQTGYLSNYQMVLSRHSNPRLLNTGRFQGGSFAV